MFNAFGNATEVPAAHWRAEPQTRGTWNILSTCLFTLLLCLWTALHLNIPGHKEGFWRPKLRKTGWLILGLLTPEMGVFTAWYQYLAAHKLNSVMWETFGKPNQSTWSQRLARYAKRCCGLKNKPDLVSQVNDIELTDSSTASTRRHPWTTIHSYYVLMGGFVFDTSDAEVNFLPNNRERLTLTPAGLRYILENEPGILPDISWESIYDKSKANSLAKSLVCIQALWFCVQCIIRLGQGFAISLLELNVFGHAFCALIMYIIWWDKPLDIEEPTLISGSVADEICALMCMRSSSDRSISPFVARPLELPYGVKYGDQWWQNIVNEAVINKWPKHLPGRPWAFKWLSREKDAKLVLECRLDWSPDPLRDTQADLTSRHSDPTLAMLTYQSVYSGPIPEGIDAEAARAALTAKSSTFEGFRVALGHWSRNPLKFSSPRQSKPSASFIPLQRQLTPQDAGIPVQASVELCHADTVRWRLCARALHRYEQRSPLPSSSMVHSLREYPALHSVNDRSPNIPSNSQLAFMEENSDRNLLQSVIVSPFFWLSFIVGHFIYGGMHLLAWNAPFPSHTSKVLWLSSGTLVASAGIFWSSAFALIFVIIIVMNVARTLLHLDRASRKTNSKFRNIIITSLISISTIFLYTVFLPAYLLARGYLVVESFIQLAHLPESAYMIPKWSQYFPHFS